MAEQLLVLKMNMLKTVDMTEDTKGGGYIWIFGGLLFWNSTVFTLCECQRTLIWVNTMKENKIKPYNHQ